MTPNPPATNQAALLRWAADRLDADMERFFAEWPDEPRNSPYALGRKDAAAELRRLAAEAPHTETQDAPWLSDSARIGRALIWSWSDVGKGAFGEGYRAAQAEARALLGGERGTDQQLPAVVAQPGKETQFGIPCSLVATRHEHTPHDWAPQPGMNLVHCPGFTKEPAS